jgi:TPR repeat protein
VQAYEKLDFARAFELYRELAELGQADAQEALAVMYMNAEGVTRDNALGYAWAKIALEQGPREGAQNIANQLASHVSEDVRPQIAALQAQFGKEALQKSLLPLRSAGAPAPAKCTMKSPVSPDDYYPREAISRGVAGHVLMDTKIWGDGRAHDPRVEYSLPEQAFEAAGRAMTLRIGFGPQIESGVAVPCSIRFKVKFSKPKTLPAEAHIDADKIAEIRKRAAAGDARAQLLYASMLEALLAVDDAGTKDTSLFLTAAQAGLPAAQFKVGHHLMGGFGVQKDEAKGAIWLEKASVGSNLDAQVELANYYLRDFADGAKVAKAAQWLERASGNSVEARFYLSALLASSPEDALRNPQRALELVKQGLATYDENPVAFEIRAAALANLGDFDGAQKNQAKAVEMAKGLRWNTAPQKARLDGYRANQAWTGDLFAFY